MNFDLKKALLAGTALVAVGAFSATSAHAQTELTDGVTISATDVAGVTETEADNTVTIDTNGAGITLGADGTESVIMNSAGDTLTLNVDNSGTNNLLTFADDIVETAGDIVINIVDNTPVTFEGNVSASPITVGSAGADATTALTFDNANDEAQTVAATINAVDAGDTVNIAITSTDVNANTQTFSGAIGGTTAATAVDAITIGQDTTTQMDVIFGSTVNAATIAIGSANGNDATNNVTFGTDGATSEVTGVISGVGTDDTNNVLVAGGSTVTFNSAFGANIDAITIGADGSDTSATFKDNIASGAITLGAGAGTVDTNTLTLDGTVTVAGAITEGDAGDTNNIVLTGGDEITTTGAVTADTITVGGGVTFDANAAVTANVNLGTSSIFEIATGQDITGAVDNTSGTAGQGELIVEGVTTVSGKVGETNALSVVAIGNGAASFSETVNANTIDFDHANGVANFAMDVTTNLITFDGLDGDVNLADGVDVSGAIDNSFPTGGTSGAGAVAGTLTAAGSSIIAGNVGATNSLTAVNAGAAGSTSVFQGNVTADDVDVTGTGSVEFQGDVTVANDIKIADDGTALFTGTDATITGDIEGTGPGGFVVVGNGTDAANVSFTGEIGDAVNVEGFQVSAEAIATIVDDVEVTSGTAGAINLDGTLNVDTTGKAILIDNTGAGAMALDGILNVYGTAANALTLGSGGTVHAGWNDTAATANIRNQVILTDNFLVGNSEGDAYRINVGATDGVFDPTATYAVDATAGVVRIADGSVLTIGVDEDSDIALEDGDQVLVINSSTDLALGTADNTGDSDANYSYEEALAGGQLVIGDTGLLSLTVNDANDAQDLVLDVAIQDAAQAYAAGSTGSGAANALVALGAGAGGNADLDAIRVRLLSSNTATSQNIAESISPTVEGGSEMAAIQSSNLSINTVSSRLQSARGGSANTGAASGNLGEGVNAWIEGFGQLATRDQRSGVAGYDADTFGVAVGVDTENMYNNTVVGVSLSYANTDVDGDDANNTQSDVNSYQVSVYGDYDYGNNVYVGGLLGFAYNDIDQTRQNVAATAGNNANADYDSQQYIAYVEAGQKRYLNNDFSITPHVLANYQHVSIDDYTETGSTANLTVDTEDLDILELGVGIRGEGELADTMGNTLRPSVEVGYRYDVIGDEVEATSSFVGGGASFQTTGADADQGTFNAGLGVTYELQNNWSFTADYDYQMKSDYDAHAGLVRANYKF